ncbi:transcriptional regulator with XRE-family HTH domain [Clostridiales Family XIII bacterium PM5-7]
MELYVQLELAKSLADLRHAHRYTQEYVADYLHMCRSAYAQFETGKRMPSIGVILKLSDLYGVSSETILHRDSYKVQLIQLMDIYQQLSPYRKGCLMERAEMLLASDGT